MTQTAEDIAEVCRVQFTPSGRVLVPHMTIISEMFWRSFCGEKACNDNRKRAIEENEMLPLDRDVYDSLIKSMLSIANGLCLNLIELQRQIDAEETPRVVYCHHCEVTTLNLPLFPLLGQTRCRDGIKEFECGACHGNRPAGRIELRHELVAAPDTTDYFW